MNILPNSDKELSKISKEAWDRKDANFEKFIESYTKEVNLFRRKSLPPNIKSYEPDNMKNSKKGVNIDVFPTGTENYVSDLIYGTPSISNEQVAVIRNFDMIGGNEDVVGNVIHLSLSEKNTNNQNFDMIEGNVNVVNDYDELFKKYINEDECL
ncbi:24565_t:CDS:1 [Gigaspora rosea]|nr:24565_t:CDS:1 [Gigaspora rosea]